MRNYFPTYSAEIRLRGDIIEYRIEDRNFTFYVPDIVMVGEFSAPPGLFGADYFFSILTSDRERPLDIPAYAEGIFETFQALRERIPGMLRPTLQMQSGFASRIMYPEEYAGKPLYHFRTRSKPLVNLPIIRKFGVMDSVTKGLSEEAEKIIAGLI